MQYDINDWAIVRWGGYRGQKEAASDHSKTVLKWRQEMPPINLNLTQKRDLHAKPLRYHFMLFILAIMLFIGSQLTMGRGLVRAVQVFLQFSCPRYTRMRGVSDVTFEATTKFLQQSAYRQIKRRSALVAFAQTRHRHQGIEYDRAAGLERAIAAIVKRRDWRELTTPRQPHGFGGAS